MFTIPRHSRRNAAISKPANPSNPTQSPHPRSSRKKVVIAGITVLALSACSSTIHTTSKLGPYDVLSIDAKQRLVIAGTRPGTEQRIICTEPSPDAIVAAASYAAARAQRNVSNTGSDGSVSSNNTNGAAGFGRSESVGSIGLRTPTIQLLRDGYFRVCEAYLNGAIGKSHYDGVVRNIDSFMITLVAIEAIGGVVTAPAITIASGGSLTLGADGSVTSSGTPGTPTVEKIQGMAKNITKDQALAIIDIVRSYQKNRIKRQ